MDVERLRGPDLRVVGDGCALTGYCGRGSRHDGLAVPIGLLGGSGGTHLVDLAGVVGGATKGVREAAGGAIKDAYGALPDVGQEVRYPLADERGFGFPHPASVVKIVMPARAPLPDPTP
jgi:hypothetical protein